MHSHLTHHPADFAREQAKAYLYRQEKKEEWRRETSDGRDFLQRLKRQQTWLVSQRGECKLLTAEEVAEQQWISVECVRADGQARRLVAYQIGKDTFYPSWQFIPGVNIPGIARVPGRLVYLQEILEVLGNMEPVRLHDFFNEDRPEFGEQSAVDYLRSGGDLETVLEAAWAYVSG